MEEQRRAGQQPAPALIVCPPTLVGHWHHEIGKFVAPDVLQPLAVQGPPQVRDGVSCERALCALQQVSQPLPTNPQGLAPTYMAARCVLHHDPGAREVACFAFFAACRPPCARADRRYVS